MLMTKLKALREGADLTQVQLSVAADVSPVTIGQLERAAEVEDIEGVQLATLRKLSHTLGVSPVQIIPILGRKDSSK